MKRIERQGVSTVPTSRRYPTVRGGICEFCGVLDPFAESTDQYKLCPHYRGLDLHCSYCPTGKDATEVNRKTILNIYDKPGSPDELVVVCDTFECVNKHQSRFKISL